MISAILGLVHGFLGWLAGVLPDSPFASLLAGTESIATGIGWLNWFIPVSDLLVIFGLYLAALLVWAAIDFLAKRALKTVTGVVGK